MIRNEIPANAEKTEGAYRAEIVELQAEVSKLEDRIRVLHIQKLDIEEGNEESLKSRQEKLDSIISEQHKIKDTIVSGAAELQENKKALIADKQAHENNVKEHQASVVGFEERKQGFLDGIRRLEDDLKSQIESYKNKSEELSVKEKDIDEKTSRINKLLNDVDLATKANEEEGERLEALEKELDSQADALNSDKVNHSANVLAHKKNIADFEDEKQASIARIARSEEILAETRRLKAETDDQYLKLLDLRATTNQRIATLAQRENTINQTLQQLTELKEKIIQGGKENEKIT